MKRRIAMPLTFLCMLVAMANAESGLLDVRKGFETKLVREVSDKGNLPESPDSSFSIVKYATPIGEMQAYLSKPEEVEKKHPAIIWITGGFPPGGIGDWIWESFPNSNNQSALAYQQAGIVMMYPSFRGSCGNPGKQESFLGEVDDVLAALKYLQKVPYVDPNKIYLGGHSTGGTLALLVAESTKEFKGVLAFGAVSSPSAYGSDSLSYDPANGMENRLRSPINYLESISSPTFLIEGTGGNIVHLDKMSAVNKNPKLKCFTIKGASHFDLLYPLNQLLASRISSCAGDGSIQITQEELQQEYDGFWTAQHEAEDLDTLASVRARGTDIRKKQTVSYYLWAESRAPLDKLVSGIGKTTFDAGKVTEEKTGEGETYYLLVLHADTVLADLNAVFINSQKAREIASRNSDVHYDGWFIEKE